MKKHFLKFNLIIILALSGCGGGGKSTQNISPVAISGDDKSVVENSEVTLDGSYSTDSDGNIISYQWEQIAGLTVSLQNGKEPITKFTAPDTDIPEPVIFKLTVTDDSGAKSTDNITVIVKPLVGSSTLNTDIVIFETENINNVRIIGNDGKGSIIFDNGETLPSDWEEDKVVIIPPNDQIKEGMAIKINSIRIGNSSTTVLYSSPSFDEVFDDIDIDIAEDSIKVGMIEDIYSNKSAKVSLKNKSRKFLEVSDYEWFPNFGTLKTNISPPLPSLESGQIENTDLDALRLSLDEISYSLNGLVIAKGKSGTATRGDSITLGGEVKIKKPFISAALRYKGANQANNLKMLSLLKYDLEKNITIESKANIKGDIAGVIDIFDKGWKCGSVVKLESEHVSLDIAGAAWESEVCLGGFRVGLGYVGVIVGNGSKSIPVPLAMDVFITTNAKFEIGISSKLTLSKKSHRDMGFWIEPAIDVYETFSDEYDTTEYLRTGKKVAPVWKKTIEGKAFGSMSMSVGTAQALKVLGIYPVVSRAYGGPELKAIVKGSIEEDGLNGCYEMSLSPLYGYAFGFGLSAKVKLANLPGFWDKKTIGKSISYTYKKDNSKDDNKSGVKYNNCLPEGYTASFNVVVNSDGTTFNDVNVIHSEVTGTTNIVPTSVLWNVYSNGQLVTKDSGDSLNYELPSGNYAVSMVATLPDGKTLTDIRNITVYSAPTNIKLFKEYLDATLSWGLIQGVQEYKICLSEQPIVNGVCPSENNLSTSSANSTIFYSLKPNQQYYVGVFYQIDSTKSAMSDIFEFSIEESDGDFPLSLVSVTDSSINLSWSTPNRATSYRVCQSGFDIAYLSANDCTNLIDGDWWEPVLTESLSVSSSPNGEALQANKEYHFRVVAVDEINNIVGVSTEVVAKIKDSGLTTKKGLVAHYKFDDDVLDSSTYENNGIISGNISFDSGVVGKAVKIGDCRNPGHIRVANSDSLKFQNEFTVTYFIKLDSNTGMNGYGSCGDNFPHARTVFAKDHDRTGYFNHISIGSDGTFTSRFANNSYSSPKVDVHAQQTGQFALNNWVHVSLVINKTEITGYINGIETNHYIEQNIDLTQGDSRDLYIGKFSDKWFPLGGSIDDFRLYNRALSPTEIKKIAEQ